MKASVKQSIPWAVLALLAVLPVAAEDGLQFIAASAHNSGANDTLWLTDARVFNPDAVRSITVALAFLPEGSDNSSVAEHTVTIAPRQAAQLDDLVAALFGEARSGAIRLRSDDEFFATSRTYNVGDGAGGTFGQFIPASFEDAALAHGILIQVANDPALTGFRTNVGFVNPDDEACSVSLSVYDVGSGTLIGSASLELPPLGFRQVNNVFDFVGAAATVARNASVEYAASRAVLAYASVVDNTSGDAILVSPFADSGTPATANNPPDGTITAPEGDVTIATGSTVAFAGTANDPDGDQVTVLWDFGDGMTATDLAPGDHTYTAAGAYTVSLTATDSQGLADPTPATRTVTVQGGNTPPDGTITDPAGDVTVATGQAVAFAGAASDPDGDQVTVLWDFGDGTSSTRLNPGDHPFAAAGVYHVTFTATDSQGLADPTPDTRTVTVEGGNAPPDGTITAPAGDVTVATGQAVAFAGAASDPDGDQVTVLWNFGDGTSSTQLNPGDHAFSAAGVYSVTFTATDGQGLADPTPDTRTVTVEAPNSPPDGTISAPAGDVTVTAGDTVTFSGSVSDPDGEPVTVLWDFGDGITSTQLDPGGHTYSTAGVFSVTFTATDSRGLSDPTPDTRTITVNPPVAAVTLTQVQADVFTPRCASCHGAGGEAGLNLEAGQSHSNLVNVPATTMPGLRVVPNDPDSSALVQMLEGGHRSLAANLIQEIRDWISDGAQDN